jgi:hypothetical protein
MKLDSRGGTITVLMALLLIQMIAVFAAYHFRMPAEVCTTMLGAFTGVNGALMIALNGSNKPNPPNPPGGPDA